MSTAVPDARFRSERDVGDVPLRATGAEEDRTAEPGRDFATGPTTSDRNGGRIGCPTMLGSKGEGRDEASTIRCTTPGAPFDPGLVGRARREYAASGRRTAVLGPSISSDPAWNILLDLLLTEAAGRRLSVTGVCHGARSSLTTGGRYLELLQTAGLVERFPDDVDRRRTYVRLTATGKATVAALLDAGHDRTDD